LFDRFVLLQEPFELLEMTATTFLVGTLNLLGDASNPVEFLPKGGTDEDAAGVWRNYELLEGAATSLTLGDVNKLSDQVRDAAGTVRKRAPRHPLERCTR